MWLFGLIVWRVYGGERGKKRFNQLQTGRLSLWKRITGFCVWVLTPLYWLYVAKYFESIDPGYKYSIINLREMLIYGALWFLLSLGVYAYAKWRHRRSVATRQPIFTQKLAVDTCAPRVGSTP